MNKKVKDLANELSVSKQTIQYHYNKLPISNQQSAPMSINGTSFSKHSF